MKTLIGFITYAGGKYCRKEFIKALKNIEGNYDVVAVTNSGEDDQQDLQAQLGMGEVLINETQEKDPKDQVVSNRNKLREYFLEGDWEQLLFLDHDVIVPSDILTRLSAHGHALCSGFYLMFRRKEGEKAVVVPCVFVKRPDGLTSHAALIDVLQPRTFEAEITGMGCTLIARKLLEAIAYRVNIEDGVKSTEDTPFCLDAHEHFGIRPLIDTRVACIHRKFEPGNERNAYLEPARYQLQVKKR